MKQILLTLITFSSAYLSGQWVTRNVDNGIDDPYRITYCSDTRNVGLLKLEENEGDIAFYLGGSYFCSDNPIIDIGIIVNGKSVKYNLIGRKSRDSKTVFLIDNLLSEDNTDFLSDFKKATELKLRVNEETCTDEYYTFKMTGSSRAINFILGK
jgi:hypothetical protein